MPRSRQSVRLTGLKRYRSGKAEYVYHRRSGVRLPNLPENDPDFLKAYMAAEETSSKPKKAGPGSLEAVINMYFRSKDFLSLSSSYGALMRRELNKVIGKAAAVPFAQIQKRHIKKDIAELAPNAARARLKAWKGLCKYAEELHRADDPSAGVSPPKTPKTRGHIPWVAKDIIAFRQKWAVNTPQRLAFELIYWTAARMSDAVRLGPGMVDGTWLTFTQQKTGNDVFIPWVSAPDFANQNDLDLLKEAIAAQPRHMTFMVTAYGASRSEKAASQWFSLAAREAGVKKTAHGLRKARAINFAERCATTKQMAAWLGHESLKEVEFYSREAEKKRILMGVESEQKLSRRSSP